jgi:hypothetical protein
MKECLTEGGWMTAFGPTFPSSGCDGHGEKHRDPAVLTDGK